MGRGLVGRWLQFEPTTLSRDHRRTVVPELAPTVTARCGWRIGRPIQEMFLADTIVTDLFRFDCQMGLMCLANGENTVT